MKSSRRRFLEMSPAASLGALVAPTEGAVNQPAGTSDYITEPRKRVPVARSVDVIVCAGGVSGLFAALAAAKYGAKVVVIERFGDLGGNIGPGILVGGHLYREVSGMLHDGKLPSIPKAFTERVDGLLRDLPNDFATTSLAVARVSTEMMKEAGVELIMSAYPADPIMESNRVRGLFVETKSGRIAVRSKIVIDASGDADIARRAGAPIRYGCGAEECRSGNVWSGYLQPQYQTWNDGGIYFVVAGADVQKYRAFSGQKDFLLGADDERFFKEHLQYVHAGWTRPMAPILRRGWETGEFRVIREIAPKVFVCLNNFWFTALTPGLAGSRSQVHGEFNAGDWKHVALGESELRCLTYDAMRFYRKHVPGFESSYLLFMSPFLGTRGGPHIVGEHTLTPQESWNGLRRADTLFISYTEVHRGANKAGYDMPYGMLVPKKIDNLLVTGRGSAYLRRGHDPSTRGRPNLMALGQATGMAAAMAAADNVTPRSLDKNKLQRALLKEGYYLGDQVRLRELGLV